MIIINNLDKIGLILNFIGAVLLAFAVGKVKDKDTGEDVSPSIGDGSGNYFKVPGIKRCKFYFGITCLIIGFLLQLIASFYL